MQMIKKLKNFNIIQYVTIKHGKQKYGKHLPYIYHLLKVKKVCDKYINAFDWNDVDKEIIQTAILCHDLLEDTETTYEELRYLFNKDVAQIVFNVSGFGCNRKERNMNAYGKIKNDSRSVFVKLCDRISNVEESMTYPEKLYMYREEYETFKRHVFNGMFQPMWDYLESLIFSA